VFEHLTTISALPGELICILTAWSSPAAGMELQVPGCGTQVAATPKCAIIFVSSLPGVFISCILLCR
jgi:hypothetical protein